MAKDHPTGQSGLYQAFLQLKTPEQCYRFLQDVCSYSELTAYCAACWKRRNLLEKPKNEKLCRVPPGAACGFFVIRPGSSRFPPRGDPARPFSGENLHRRDIL